MAPRTPDNVEHHEVVHARACRGERIPYKWVPRGRGRRQHMVVEGSIPMFSGKNGLARAAVALMAGALAGGGDAAGDVRAARGLAAEAGVPFDDIVRRARRYL